MVTKCSQLRLAKKGEKAKKNSRNDNERKMGYYPPKKEMSMEFSDIYDLNRFFYDIPEQIITSGRYHAHQLAQKVMPLAQLSLSDVHFNYNQSTAICKKDNGRVFNGFSLLYSVKGESIRLICNSATRQVMYETVFERRLQELPLEIIRSLANLVVIRFDSRIARDVKIIEICQDRFRLKLRLKNKVIDCDVERRRDGDSLFLRPSNLRKKRPFPETQ